MARRSHHKSKHAIRRAWLANLRKARAALKRKFRSRRHGHRVHHRRHRGR